MQALPSLFSFGEGFLFQHLPGVLIPQADYGLQVFLAEGFKFLQALGLQHEVAFPEFGTGVVGGNNPENPLEHLQTVLEAVGGEGFEAVHVRANDVF